MSRGAIGKGRDEPAAFEVARGDGEFGEGDAAARGGGFDDQR